MKKKKNKVNKDALIITIVLIVCGIIIFIPALSDYIRANKRASSNVEDYAIVIKKVTKTGAKIVLENNSKISITYGGSFVVERYEDEEWIRLEPEPVVTSIAYGLKANSQKTLKINWEKLYGELDFGKYRLGKHISIGESSEDIIIYAEFTL